MNPINDYLSGCAGGMAGTIVGHPLDTVKVRMQTANKCQYNGMLNCCAQIVKTEGVSGLFRGMTSPLVGMCFINAVVFGVEAQARSYFSRSDVSSYFASGCVAGLAHALVCCPIELIKIQMQAECSVRTRYSSTFQAIRHIQKQRGVVGFSRGMVSTIIRDVPSFGCYFVTFELLNDAKVRKMFHLQENKLNNTLQILVAGGVAGQAAWVSTYPFDVIKSRLQAEAVTKSSSVSQMGQLQYIAKLYRHEGIQTFFRGLSPVLLRAFPVNATTFAVVHLSNSYLNDDDLSSNSNQNNNKTESSVLLSSTVFSSLSPS